MLAKKRLPATGSDGDLPSAIFDDQFDLALRKLRDPLVPGNSLRGSSRGVTPVPGGAKRPKILNLAFEQPPSLRLAFDAKAEAAAKEEFISKKTVEPLNKVSSVSSECDQ